VGLVYDPRELSGVTTARPEVPGVLQVPQERERRNGCEGKPNPRSWKAVKDTTYPSVGAGSAGSFGTRQASSSAADINLCFTSFYRCPNVTIEGVQSCSAMAHGGRKGNTFTISVFLLPISFSLTISLSCLFSSFFIQLQGRK
jgi:hypothetical protein